MSTHSTSRTNKKCAYKKKQHIIINNNLNKPLTLVGIIQMYFIENMWVKIKFDQKCQFT